jgi:NDP-sugar pyrophosphorylase family protein
LNAFILAAGLGTRLKPLTDHMPKAMVPVGGKPLIEHLILKLKASGFQHIVVNVHHFAQQIVDFIDANQQFGIDIRISDESERLLDTGGAIRRAAPLFPPGEPFLIHNVDILHNLDLAQAYRQHEADSGASLFVSQRQSNRHLLFDKTGQLVGRDNTTTGEIDTPFTEVKSHPDAFQAFPFSGIHIFSPSLLPLMDSWPEKFPVINFYLDAAAKGHRIKGIVVKDLSLLDVGKLNTLEQAENFIQ